MPAPHLRSTSVKLRHRRSPGGRSITIGKLRKASAVLCALCRTKLHGVPRLRTGALAKLAKTQKRPERLFGGVLCSGCTRDVLVDRARLQSGALQPELVPLTRMRYIRALKG